MNTQNPGSSSTSYLQNCEQPVTPESVRPYPKAVRCKSNNARKKRKVKNTDFNSREEQASGGRFEKVKEDTTKRI